MKNCDLLPETGHLLALGQAAGDGHQSNFHFNPLLFAFGYAPQKMEQKKVDPLVNDRIPRIYRPCRGDAPFSDTRRHRNRCTQHVESRFHHTGCARRRLPASNNILLEINEVS